MQNEKITIEIHRDETGKIKVNVLPDGVQLVDLLQTLDKAHTAVRDSFEMACKADGITSHFDRKALLQKLIFNNEKTI
jgi:hypothetical protein